jgi:hypothetical protein
MTPSNAILAGVLAACIILLPFLIMSARYAKRSSRMAATRKELPAVIDWGLDEIEEEISN